MKNKFYFGEKIDGFDVRVFNEREVRAASGILFLFAVTSFFNAFLLADFRYIKLFVVAFFIDFFIRIFINPNYSPSMILGRFIVSNQKVEYAGAPQKRFAWGIGLVLSIVMFFLVVVNNVTDPINLVICSLCLTFLFFEAAFGICVGCKIYNLFSNKKAKLCPGGVCELIKKEEIQKISLLQVLIVIVFIALMIFISI